MVSVLVFGSSDPGTLRFVLTLTVPLSTQVYKWVLANRMLGKPCNGLASHPGGGGGVEILLVASCYRNRHKLRPDGPLGSYEDFTFTVQTLVY